MDRVHVSVDQSGVLGPPWTDGGVDRGGLGHGGALTTVRPPAAPVLQSSSAGAQKGERSMGSSARASPELGWRCGGRATVVQNREAAALGEDTAEARRERKRSGGRCGATRGWCSPFIGAGGASGRGGRGG
jgi:capsular polysaccharide biosynthesis protein